MSFLSEVVVIFRGIGAFFLRRSVHKRWVQLAKEMDVNIKYPAHIFGDVGEDEVWISAKIANTDHGIGPAIIYLEASPNTPLPTGAEPEQLCDVILEPKCDNKTLRKEMEKLLRVARKFRQRAIDEDGFVG